MKKASREIIEITLAIIGVVVGISACALFAAKYHNYSAGVWAAISAAFALFFLYIVLSVRRDVQHQITLVHFLVYTVIGGIGIVAGLAVFIAYLVIGLKDNEKGKIFLLYVTNKQYRVQGISQPFCTVAIAIDSILP